MLSSIHLVSIAVLLSAVKEAQAMSNLFGQDDKPLNEWSDVELERLLNEFERNGPMSPTQQEKYNEVFNILKDRKDTRVVVYDTGKMPYPV